MHDIEEVKKQANSEVTTLEVEVGMLREDLMLLKMELPPYDRQEEAYAKKKPWWRPSR